MTQEVEKITRHQDEHGTVFQVHHLVQSKAHNVLAEFALVFRERKNDKGEDLPAVFCGGDPHRILALPELKEAAPVPESVAEPAASVPAKTKAKPAPVPQPEPILVPAGAPKDGRA